MLLKLFLLSTGLSLTKLNCPINYTYSLIYNTTCYINFPTLTKLFGTPEEFRQICLEYKRYFITIYRSCFVRISSIFYINFHGGHLEKGPIYCKNSNHKTALARPWGWYKGLPKWLTM